MPGAAETFGTAALLDAGSMGNSCPRQEFKPDSLKSLSKLIATATTNDNKIK